MKLLKNEWLNLIAFAAMLIASLYALPQVADTLPVHWNLQGEADRVANKYSALFMMPLIVLCCYLLFTALPKLDAKSKENQEVLNVSRDVMVVAFSALHILIITNYLGANFSIIRMASLTTGIVLLCIGNVLPKTSPNYVVGLRLPWLYKSNKAWYVSQRLSGYLLSFIGLSMIAIAIFTQSGSLFLTTIILMFIGIIAITAYSYKVYKQAP